MPLPPSFPQSPILGSAIPLSAWNGVGVGGILGLRKIALGRGKCSQIYNLNTAHIYIKGNDDCYPQVS